LQKHVGRGEFIDNTELAGFAPEVGEPAANDGLVIFLFGHAMSLLYVCKSLISVTCVTGNPSERLTNSASCRDIEASTASAAERFLIREQEAE
jgi:hypothetical protein